MATGQVDLGLKLHTLNNAEEIKDIKIHPDYYQSYWIVGFGWDQHRWKNPQMPHKKILDEVFPNTPVFLSRVDGHTSWLNQAAINEFKNMGYDFTKPIVGGKIEIDAQGEMTGILYDQAHIKALLMLPGYKPDQLKKQALRSMKIFNQAGFTHVRDLSMTSTTAQILNDLYQSNLNTLCVEGFVTAESVHDLDRAFEDYQESLKSVNPYLRLKGLKIFVDGSLGSKSAYISKPYVGTDHMGLITWAQEDVAQALRFCWDRNLELAVHVIGDQAAHIVVESARKVSAEGVLGRLHLEHVQLLRPETIQMMKPLHVFCHMQPCHWLSDHTWLDSVIGTLSPYQFSWEALRRNKIPVDWGSDSPIEKPSILNNLKALKLSHLSGVPQYQGDFIKAHEHSDSKWTESHTVIDDNQIIEVIFDGKKII